MNQPQVNQDQMAREMLLNVMSQLAQMQSAPGQQGQGPLPGSGPPLQGTSIQRPQMPQMPTSPLNTR